MASCNSWQYLVTILAKNFPRSWQDLAKILLRYPWRVDPGIHLILEALKLIRDKFVNNIFYMESFGNSVAESKLGAEAGHYLLFNIVQCAHHSLITVEKFQYPRVYM